ncbi:MAG: hypothetical protein IKV08_03615 [Phascolarctobacterium sp.]|nr:hypothetical protein [Phascolarctobacterium sp.]
MNKLQKAIEMYFTEWSEQLDREMAEAEARGELPNKTPEQMKKEAAAIWEKAHPNKHQTRGK